MSRKRRSILEKYLVHCMDGAMDANTIFCSCSIGSAPESSCRGRRTAVEKNIKMKQMKKIVAARGCTLYTQDGQVFLDCISSVSHVGHCHPKVVAAAQHQMAKLGSGTIHIKPDYRIAKPGGLRQSRGMEGRQDHSNFQKLLLETFHVDGAPAAPKFDTVLSFHSGSQATEAAIRLAREHTGNYDVVVFEECFHGCLSTSTLVSAKMFKETPSSDGDKDSLLETASTSTERGKGKIRQPQWVHVLPVPDLDRGPFRGMDPKDASDRYFKMCQDILNAKANQGRRIACLLSEPIFTFHSVLVPEPSFMQKLVRLVRELGGLVIIDEVQTGLGRTGNWWGFQALGIVPDIVTSGKPLANGHPLSVLVTSSSIAAKEGAAVRLFGPSRYKMSAMQEAVGSTVLSVIRQEGLMANATSVGGFLKESIQRLIPDHPNIGRVQGGGLLLGVELVQRLPDGTTSPSPDVAEALLFMLREKRIVLAVEGKHRNVMFLIPPLAFSKDDAAHFLTQLSECIKCIEKLLSISDVPSEDRETRSSTVEQQSCPAGPGTWKKKQRALNFLGKSPTDLDLSASSRLEDWLSQESQRFSFWNDIPWESACRDDADNEDHLGCGLREDGSLRHLVGGARSAHHQLSINLEDLVEESSGSEGAVVGGSGDNPDTSLSGKSWPSSSAGTLLARRKRKRPRLDPDDQASSALTNMAEGFMVGFEQVGGVADEGGGHYDDLD